MLVIQVYRRHWLCKVAVDDAAADRRLVQLQSRLGCRCRTLEVYSHAPEAPEVLERCNFSVILEELLKQFLQ